MAKRKTKEQREQEQYDALHQRIRDICIGACGEVRHDDDWFLCANELSRVVPALEQVFCVHKSEDEFGNEYLFSTNQLSYYDSPASIAEFFFRHGVRA